MPALQLGVAFSGGGSRAAAFHRGTLRALGELGLLDAIGAVSSVSGGSVFAAAWLYARARQVAEADFLMNMREELARGFIWRTVRPRLLKTLIPGLGYSRTDALAETFDDAFFDNATLSALPASPRLLINTAILENGHVAQFSRAGFSTWDIHGASANAPGTMPVDDFSLALAVAASAAFPIGLPPVRLTRNKLGARFVGALEGKSSIHLTDGGVIEDLGVQTLLRSDGDATWDLVVSDANAPLPEWRPGFVGLLRSFGAWLFSDGVLERVMLLMNDKQNRWARHNVMDALDRSVLLDGIRHDRPALHAWVDSLPDRPRRNVLLARLEQTWDRFIARISPERLVEIARGAKQDVPRAGDVETITSLLEQAHVDLSAARKEYEALGGDTGARRAAVIETNFTALGTHDLDILDHHAAWQIRAAHAVYGSAIPG